MGLPNKTHFQLTTEGDKLLWLCHNQLMLLTDQITRCLSVLAAECYCSFWYSVPAIWCLHQHHLYNEI